MKAYLGEWSLILLCFSMAGAIGGGLYEHIVLPPLWKRSPPASFSVIQPNTGVPLQRFWIPVHLAITVFVVAALVLTFSEAAPFSLDRPQTFWTWFREPLDVLSFLCFLLALFNLRRLSTPIRIVC